MITFPYLGQAGRLGNQLWQIASTIGIAEKLGDEPRFSDWDYRPYFRVPDSYFGSLEGGTEVTEFVPHIDPRARVYLQDHNLFSHIREEIRSFFQPSDLALEKLDEYEEFWALDRPMLSVHVRRGDNVPGNDPGTPDKHLYHPLRSLAYYNDAIDVLRDRCATVAVFSDDPEWCRENLKADYFHQGVTRPKEHEPEYKTAPIWDWVDLFLQVSADRHVCSNSTYAWWGAYLSNDPQPIVPSRLDWYGPNLRYINAGLMIPSTWTELPNRAD